MTPSALRAYLKQRGEASLVDLTAHFGTDSGLLEDLLILWKKKGQIEEVTAACGKSCCRNGRVTLYRWRECLPTS